jgi:hypothetical protein
LLPEQAINIGPSVMALRTVISRNCWFAGAQFLQVHFPDQMYL